MTPSPNDPADAGAGNSTGAHCADYPENDTEADEKMAEHTTTSDDTMRQALAQSKTVAVVGLSPKPDKDSHQVAAYLQRNGYRIIPVNPTVDEVLGEKSYPDLKAVPEKVDIVDVFRKPEAVPEIADQAIEIGAKILWTQLGVVHEEAAKRASDAGLTVIQDACMKVEHHRLTS